MRYRVMRAIPGGPRETFDCDDLPADLHTWPVVSVTLLEAVRPEAIAAELYQEAPDAGRS